MSSPSRLGGSAPLKPPSHTAEAAEGAKGDGPRRRTYSDSSASSAASAESSKPEDQFFFSPHQTPASEKPPFFSAHGCSSFAGGQLDGAPPQTSSSSIATNSPTPHSRPIAIELPASVSRKINNNSVYTPIEPLSGRGDISGGYFPFHEDPSKRIHRPHPFHTDKEEASRQRIDHATEGSIPSSCPDRSTAFPNTSAMSEPQGHYPMLNVVKMPRGSRGNTPVTSYVPSGFPESPMPVGKYYPSNYEKRNHSSHHSCTQRSNLQPSSASGPSSVKSDTVVPQLHRTDSSHARSDSDAKRRLVQYQRDMVAQATLAARHIASGQGASASLAAAGKHGASLQKFQIVAPHRPVSPRLQPLGSPGPVTPIDLDGHGGDGAGYLTRGRAVPSPNAGMESEAVARAIKAENERRRREGRGSPAVEAGGFGF